MHGFGGETTNRVDKAIRVGTVLPTTCHRGELFFLVRSVNKIYASFSVDTWTEIASSGGSGGVVSSVFARTGAVAAIAGDYTFDKIGAGSNLNALVIGTGGTLGVTGTGLINGKGSIIITTAAAPADGALAAGQLTIWLDPDNTTPAVNFKAKKTNGSVVTATVLLT